MRVPHPCVNLLFVWLAANVALSAQAPVRRTFAIVVNGKVVGYQIDTETTRNDGERAVVDVTVKSLVKLELLGSSFDQQVEQTWTLDPATRAVLRVDSTLTAGGTRIAIHGELRDGGFAFGSDKGTTKSVVDPTKVVIGPDYRFLLRPQFAAPERKVKFEWFMPEAGGVFAATASPIADAREFTVLGTKVTARGWTIVVPAAGITMTMFLTPDGQVAHSEVPAMKLVVAPAAPAMVERIQRMDLTNTILGKTNLRLDDPTPLTFMKVRARIEATADLTAAQLSGPGQEFTGTVADGVIDGVFTIHPARPDGTESPAFPIPPGTFAQAELQPYLRPEHDIESEDPAIVAKAKELAAGATTCFEVLRRCADWVHSEVRYTIPGGGSAQRVMATRQGECGGHSRLLAAMLRALGIPARTPMGGMYVPLYGGSFGQHMWNEVWLGKSIGWLAVDCTAGQSTFIDASHIRLSTALTAFRPKTLEVLDWQPKSAAGPTAAAPRRNDAFPWAPGETQTFLWLRGGERLGEETFTYDGKTEAGHVFTGTLQLAGGKFTETSRTEVGDDGAVRALRVERVAGTAKTTFEVRVAGGKATVQQQQGDEQRSDEVEIEAGAFAIHNNCVGHVALLASRLGALADGQEARVDTVHDESHSMLGLQLRGGAATEIEIGGVKLPAQTIVASLAGTEFTLHVDTRGRLLRWEQAQGAFRAELQSAPRTPAPALQPARSGKGDD